MRDKNVPADTMTIDCLKSKKRIIMVLHDHELENVYYQESYIDVPPDAKFDNLALQNITVDFLYTKIHTYFKM